MEALIVGSEDVRRLLPMEDCLHVMRETFKALARGDAAFPPRRLLQEPGKKGILGMMPGYIASSGLIGLKATSVFPGNLGTKYEAHQGAVLLFETVNGRLLAVVDASSITEIRTGAVSGVATDVLSRKDSRTLAILGSGTQAKVHLQSMLAVRPGISSVRIWSRDPSHAEAFASHESMLPGASMVAAREAAEAVKGADIVCTVTGAKEPILKGAWLSPGTHVNAVGASVPPYRELDTEAVVRSRFFVDSRESALNEADDFRIPKQEKVVDDSHIKGDLGQLLTGEVAGRTADDEITVFKSVGLAVEDLAAADFVYRRALSMGLGTKTSLNAERHAGH